MVQPILRRRRSLVALLAGVAMATHVEDVAPEDMAQGAAELARAAS